MTSHYVYAKKNPLAFRVLKLKKQVLKMYNTAEQCHKNYPNIKKDEITVMVEQIMEARNCVDGVESCFTDSISGLSESDIDLESVMEHGCVDYKKKVATKKLKLSVKEKKAEKVENTDDSRDVTKNSICAVIGCVDI